MQRRLPQRVKLRPRMMSAATSALRQSGHTCVCDNLPNVSVPPGQTLICSINVGSSTGAFELFTRFETGHRCSKSSGRRLKYLDSCFTAQPRLEVLLGEYDRHAVVNFCNECVRDDHGAGFQCLATLSVLPFVPKSGERECGRTDTGSKVPRLFPIRRILPLVVTRRRDQTACALECVAKERLGLDCLGSRVERRHFGFLERFAPPARD